MKKRMNISLDYETAEQLKLLADNNHKSMSQWITDAVWEEEDRKKKQKRKVKNIG